MGHRGKLLDDARIVIAELAANAVAHARSPFMVSIQGRAGRSLSELTRFLQT